MLKTDYSGPMELPALACRECGHTFVLPYRKLLQSIMVDSYWPSDQEELLWICDRCQRYNVFTTPDIQMLADTPPPHEERGFWRVEIPCSEPRCAAKVIAYTQTFGQTSRRALGLSIANAHDAPRCDLGHAIRVEQCYPTRLDFVEWSGPEQHVV